MPEVSVVYERYCKLLELQSKAEGPYTEEDKIRYAALSTLWNQMTEEERTKARHFAVSLG